MLSLGKRIGMRWAIATAVVVALVVAGSLVPVLAGRAAVEEADAAQRFGEQFGDAMGDLQAFAAVDYFLKIDGIDGEATQDQREHWIQIESWSWGVTAKVGASGRAGKASVLDFSVMKMVDKASPKLMEGATTGQVQPRVRLEAERLGEHGEPTTYLTIELTNVLISSYQVGGSGGGASPMESLSLNFSKIEFEYTTFDPDGSPGAKVKASYDRGKAKK